MTNSRFATLVAALVLAAAAPAQAHDTRPNAARDNANRAGTVDRTTPGPGMMGRDGQGSGMMDGCPMMQGQGGMMGQGMMGGMTGRRPNEQWRRPDAAPAR